MMLIEAMKQLKELVIKTEDLRDKVGKFCADTNVETPTYPDQRATIDGWIQAHQDLVKRIAYLRTAIQRTNLATMVTIVIDDESMTKCIAEWIHRRKDLAEMEMKMWGKLTDRGIKEGNLQSSPGGSVTEIRIRRHYDPATRDAQRERFRGEPARINATLEVVNATTKLLEEA